VADLFDDVIGHRHVVALLRDEIRAPAQAYLFTGPTGAGKSMVARRFAAALLCGDDDACRGRVVRGIHPDVVVVEPEGRTAITVEQARSTVALASLAPLEADRRVFVFEEGGAMNEGAANALLKTLEEPTPSTVFLIITESEDDLPETVASRCRTVVFGRVGEAEVADGLARLGVDPVQAAHAARISGGRPGLALALATQPEVAEFRRVWLGLPLRLSEHPGDAFLLADEVMAAAEPLLAALRDRQQEEEAAAPEGAGRALKDRHERELRRATAALSVSGLEILAGFYRDAAAAQLGAAVRNPDIPAPALTRIAPARAVRNAGRVLDAIDSLQANQRPQLAFAALFADLGAGA
jgi:DNA polymerase III subunit delta'